MNIAINNRFRLVGPPQNLLYDTQEGVYSGPGAEVRLFASWTPQPAALAVRRLYSPGSSRYQYLSDEEKEIVDQFLAGYKAPPPKEGHIHLRVAMDNKNAYVKAAQAEGKSLSTWICDNLNQAIT